MRLQWEQKFTCLYIKETSSIKFDEENEFNITDGSRVRVHKKQIAHKERMLGMSQHISMCGRNKTPDVLSPPSAR